MENIIKSVSKTLESKLKANQEKATREKKSKPAGVCAVKLLLNPKSFTQSAENLLALSFRVKVRNAREKKCQ